jgi:repressor of nif and glnA expression
MTPSPLKFVSHTIEEYAMQVTYDPVEGTGKVVYNLSLVRTQDLPGALEVIGTACRSGVCASDHVRVVPEGESIDGFVVPEGQTGICTLCSVTLDGILLRRGVPLHPIGGGVVEIVNRVPRRFTHLIHYNETTIDPLQVLIAEEISSVSDVIRSGNGTVLANIRECHMEAEPLVAELLDDLGESRFVGVLEVGLPNSPLLGVQVSPQYMGVVAVGGTNPIAAVREAGYPVVTRAMRGMIEAGGMTSVEALVHDARARAGAG